MPTVKKISTMNIILVVCQKTSCIPQTILLLSCEPFAQFYTHSNSEYIMGEKFVVQMLALRKDYCFPNLVFFLPHIRALV